MQIELSRKTAETDIVLGFDLYGKGESEIKTGIGFLDHMLTLWAKHGRFNLKLAVKGDREVDGHHTAEDIGICLGQALAQAFGDKKGLVRYGDIILPMDEALILCAIDLSGRGILRYNLEIPTEKVGDFDTELVEEFFLAVVRESKMALHLHKLDGTNSHHIIEGAFKAFGRALRKAVMIDAEFKDEIPSTKGVL